MRTFGSEAFVDVEFNRTTFQQHSGGLLMDQIKY